MSFTHTLVMASLCLSLTGCAAWVEEQGRTATIAIRLPGQPSDREVLPVTEIATIGSHQHQFVAGRHHTLSLDRWHSYRLTTKAPGYETATDIIHLRYRPELHVPMAIFGALTTLAGAGAGGLIDLALVWLSGGRIAQHNGQTVGAILGATPPAIAILVDALSGQANRYDQRNKVLALQPETGPASAWPLRPGQITVEAPDRSGYTYLYPPKSGPHAKDSDWIEDKAVWFHWSDHGDHLNVQVQARSGGEVIVDWSQARLSYPWSSQALHLTAVASPAETDGPVTAYLGGLPDGQTAKALATGPLPAAGIDLILPAGTTGGKGARFAAIGARDRIELALPIKTMTGWRTYGVTIHPANDDAAQRTSK
jgi:hypothetical protein